MGCRFARSMSLVIPCLSDNVIPVLATKSEPHSGESGWGSFSMSYQDCIAGEQSGQLAGEFGWYYSVIVAHPMIQFLTWALLPVKLLGTRT